MPSLSLNVGLNNGRKLPFGAAAPSGIPTATTNTINISSTESGFNGDFAKASLGTWQNIDSFTLEFQFGQWRVIDSESYVFFSNTSSGQTVNYIPLTGWSPADTTVTVVA